VHLHESEQERLQGSNSSNSSRAAAAAAAAGDWHRCVGIMCIFIRTAGTPAGQRQQQQQVVGSRQRTAQCIFMKDSRNACRAATAARGVCVSV
jgi:hypothetical protein